MNNLENTRAKKEEINLPIIWHLFKTSLKRDCFLFCRLKNVNLDPQDVFQLSGHRAKGIDIHTGIAWQEDFCRFELQGPQHWRDNGFSSMVSHSLAKLSHWYPSQNQHSFTICVKVWHTVVFRKLDFWGQNFHLKWNLTSSLEKLAEVRDVNLPNKHTVRD